MVVFTFLWEKLKSLGRFLVKHEETSVLIVTLLWVIFWSFYQNWKGNEQTQQINELAKTHDQDIERVLNEQDQDIERLIKIQKANTEELTKNYIQIVSGMISNLEANQKANTEELTENYSEIVSGKISDLEANMIRLVSRNVEMLSGETVRKIIASHENIQRASDDTYKKAIDEACKAGYLYETNQEPGEAGVCIFKTGENWKFGQQEDEELSSFLLTIEEKNDIRDCLESYFEKEETEKLKDGFANTDTQKKIFSFLLRESNIGSLIISPVCEIPYWTPYREVKTKHLTPFAKLGAVIGHIGDTMTNYE